MYMLRWRFEYKNRPAKYGIWGTATGNPVDSAYCQPTDGLVMAMIEGKNITTREIHQLAGCEGSVFRGFQWVAEASLAMAVGAGAHTPRTRLSGLKLLTASHVVTVMADGSSESRLITDGETRIKSFY
jgi:hypothetical protein